MDARKVMLALSLIAGLLGACQGGTPTGVPQDSPSTQPLPAVSVM
jgi:hypothetical protein